ncbi:hypothetical protein CMALT394_540013 [Carnobacterium maltaromaticum]|nr:hypothetical protein CMALT394_540013 [Carnobacterium maltaromaticum]
MALIHQYGIPADSTEKMGKDCRKVGL